MGIMYYGLGYKTSYTVYSETDNCGNENTVKNRLICIQYRDMDALRVNRFIEIHKNFFNKIKY